MKRRSCVGRGGKAYGEVLGQMGEAQGAEGSRSTVCALRTCEGWVCGVWYDPRAEGVQRGTQMANLIQL